MRLIDADALAEEMLKADMPPHDIGGRYQTGFMDARSMVILAPTIEPTLYGYNLKHLALIAHEMEEKGITADKAAEIFADASAVVQMVYDEQKKAIDAEVKRWMT